jgi:deazaflavin-dependent oxidoreductase (nitroreductase family)
LSKGRTARFLERLVASRAGAWFFVNVAHRIDRSLLRRSRGRVSVAVGRPVALLATTGAKSGRRRETPLLYLRQGEEVVLVASNGGRANHPAWYHNLKAHPHAELTLEGRTRRYVAREATGEERDRLWRRANEAYLGYETYQRRTRGRRMPVMVLSPADRE